MSRVDISMTADEIDAFLATCTQMVVGALDGDGWPTGTIAAVTAADGRLEIRLGEHDPLLGIVADGAPVCCVADEHAAYFEIRGVIVRGRAVASGTDQRTVSVAVDRVLSFDFGRLREGSPDGT